MRGTWYNALTSTNFAIQSNRIQTKVIGVHHGNDHNTHPSSAR
jgi:hypothetical protein